MFSNLIEGIKRSISYLALLCFSNLTIPHKALEKLEQALILFKQYTYHDVAITERNIARVKEKLGEG